MTSGWAWALRTYPCTREESPSLWRPSHTSTSSSLARRSPAPTRSPWMREKCSLKRHRYAHVCSVESGCDIYAFAWLLSELHFQVGEITKIMKAYINMIVKKRCSVKSVSSYGSNWIRWSAVQEREGAEWLGHTEVLTGPVASIHFYRDTEFVHRYSSWQRWGDVSFSLPCHPQPLYFFTYTGHSSFVTWNLIQVFNGLCFNIQMKLAELSWHGAR